MNDNNVVLIEEKGACAKIVINRPKSLNALSSEVLEKLLEALNQVQQNDQLRVITLWSAGQKAFVVGADIAEMSERGSEKIAEYVACGQKVMCAIEAARVPVIAAVQGFALGGGLELALACDLIVASRKAKVGQPEVNLGIIPGFGGTQRLIQRCGVGTTRRLVYTGEIITADEALLLGVVDKVVEPDRLEGEVEALGETISKKAPLAISKAKAVIRSYGESALAAGLEQEVNAFLKVFDTSDRKEGIQAFTEKREPKFTG